MRNFNLSCVLAILTVWGIPAAEAAALFAGPRLVLVDEGIPPAPIMVAPDAAPFTIRAANELADYLEKICGTRPELMTGIPDPVPARAVWVGFHPYLTNLFPSLDFDFQHPEEILIAADENNLVIAGRDRWDPDNMVRQLSRGKTLEGVQEEYGTANAVYTFLQDYLDVRWLWPGASGEDVPSRPTIALKPFVYRYHPRIRGRAGVFRNSSLGGSGGYSGVWARRQRLQLDSLNLQGGHAFTTWWERFHETHPEYFALQPNGTRGGGAKPYPSARTVKMCKSNPALWEQWLEDVALQIEQDPARRVFNASANDSWASGFCVCDNCRAWDHPDAEPRNYSWQGLSKQYVAMSDRQVTFANHLARLLKERYPDREYYVLTAAYGNSRPAPVAAVPDDNVIVSSVALFMLRTGMLDRGSTWRTSNQDQFAGWGQVTSNIVWRPNTGSPAGWQQGRPDVPVTQTGKDIKFVAEHGCIGIYIDTVWEHWATHAPLYYLMGQLVWNPDRDPKEIMADYYRRGFGPAASSVAAYWQLMEDKRDEYFSADPVADDVVWTQRPGTRTYPQVYDEACFKLAYGLLDRAAKDLDGQPDIYMQRLAFVRAGLDYTRLLVDCSAAMPAWRESQDADAEKRLRRNWDEIGRLSLEHPEAMNWRRLEPRHGRTAGLHPDGSKADVRLPVTE
ncbi:MAG: DUF4838 domain-containing protein [Kiritimatiellia bacterium]